MDWSDEPWVKLYRRNTADWLLLSWRARGLFYSLMREVNRAGILDLGRTGKRAVAVVLGSGGDWKEIVDALDELLADGCVQINGATLVIPNFVEAQEAAQSDKARAKAARERRRDDAMGVNATDSTVTKRDATITKRDGSITDSDETVTARHAPSHGVTPRHEEKRREETTREGSAEGATAPAPPASAETASAAHTTSTGSETAAAKPARAKRAKPTPQPDTIPAPGTLARRVYEAIVGDRNLVAITVNPGDFATRICDPALYPGVDVLPTVLGGAEFLSRVPGTYTDGRAFLRNQLQRAADRAALKPKPAQPESSTPALRFGPDRTPPVVHLPGFKPTARGA